MIKDAPENSPKDGLNNLRKDAQEATIKFENKQNMVNILIFQLLLLIFNPFNDTFHYQMSLGLKGDESKLQCRANITIITFNN